MNSGTVGESTGRRSAPARAPAPRRPSYMSSRVKFPGWVVGGLADGGGLRCCGLGDLGEVLIERDERRIDRGLVAAMPLLAIDHFTKSAVEFVFGAGLLYRADLGLTLCYRGCRGGLCFVEESHYVT